MLGKYRGTQVFLLTCRNEGRKKKRRTVGPEKHESATAPTPIVTKVTSFPGRRPEKSKEETQGKAASETQTATATWEARGNRVRIRVNLMPVLASAREQEEEEEQEESCRTGDTSRQRPDRGQTGPGRVKDPDEEDEESCRRDKSGQMDDEGFPVTGLDRQTGNRQTLTPRCVLPLIRPPPQCDDDGVKMKRNHTSLPPIGLNEKTTASNILGKNSRGDGSETEETLDKRPWIHNPMFSNARSPEFRLPDISVSSLDRLLQTATQRLRRRKRSDDEEPWRRIQADGVLLVHRLREKRRVNACTQEGNTVHSVDREKGLPPLFSAPKPPVILAMTKKSIT